MANVKKKNVSKKVIVKKETKSTKNVTKKVAVTKKVSKTTPKKVEVKKEQIAPQKPVQPQVKIEPKKEAILASEKVVELFEKEFYKSSLDNLEKLRMEGESKILKLKDENIDIKINKQIPKQGKKHLLIINKREMLEAKGVKAMNKEKINSIVKTTSVKAKEEFTPIFKLAVNEKKEAIKKAKDIYSNKILLTKESYKKDLELCKEEYLKTHDKKKYKVDKNAAYLSYSSKLNAARTDLIDSKIKARDEQYKTYQTYHEYQSNLRLNKNSVGESLTYGFETYKRNFNLFNWFTKNGLILIIIVFFGILAIISNGNILQPGFLLSSLTQIAPKIFYALGVAGLILLAGTDLSIGRLTGVGVCFTLMILTSEPADGAWFAFAAAWPPAAKVIVAILVSVGLCTLFTSVAGFFTAKFKMHPFISTLAVQLVVYGLFQVLFSSISAFPLGEQGTELRNLLMGEKGWLLIIYAIVAIFVVWFIWNKTKFGRHLFAVGGNQEAATVSGINPFKITMLAFIMAGILYGLGGFVQALQAGPNNFTYGQGTETDAIAACVIGGVSFSGGVGSVGGVVLGSVILGFLTCCFNNLQLDANIQLIIKGFIILAAVTLDCIKYIRKK